MASEAISECLPVIKKNFPGGACPQIPLACTHLKVRSSLISVGVPELAPAGDIQFGLPAMQLRAGRGVATQNFSGVLCAPVAEPPFLNLRAQVSP